jgi:hypothetical protein
VMSIVRGKCLRAFGRLRSTVMACAAELATGHGIATGSGRLSQQGSTTRGAPAGAVSRKQSSHWWCYVSAVKLYGSHQQRMSTPIASSQQLSAIATRQKLCTGQAYLIISHTY